MQLYNNIPLERGFLRLCSADLGVPSGGAEAIYSLFSLLLYVATVSGCLVGTVGFTREVGDKLGQWVTLLSYPPISLLTHDQKRQGTFQIPFLSALRITFSHEGLGTLGKKKKKKTKKERKVCFETYTYSWRTEDSIQSLPYAMRVLYC